MHLKVLPALAAGLIAVGCGGGQETADAPEEPAKPSPSEKVDAAQSPDPAPEDAVGGGTMIVTYDDAQTPEAINGRALMQDNHLLEDFADDINQTLNLPHDIALHGSQCDQANAFWDASANTITICYEDADLGQRIFTEAGDADPDASAINSEYATFYHEVGHMAITVYDLPVTGREEDVADQLSAYILLTPDDTGKIDPESVQAVKDFARAFAASGAERTELDSDDFADVHSLDMQRVYNLECWIYGSNPEANADLVSGGPLPEDRASGCQEEWVQLDQAWSTLLDPYFK
jgi:hypothetical protein